MALPWLSIVARTIPWAELVRRAPQIIAASSELLEKRQGAGGPRPAQRKGASAAGELERRVESLEERDAQHAKVFEQLAKQSEDLSVAVEVLAARLRLLAWIFAATVAVASAAFWYLL